MAALRECLLALTTAFEERGPHEVIHLDVTALTVNVDSTLDDVDRRSAPSGIPVVPPNGLYEWDVRRDFVRSLPSGALKKRLGNTLAGPRTRRRFEITLSSSRVVGAREGFLLFRRHRLRAYAGRVLRFHLGQGRD